VVTDSDLGSWRRRPIRVALVLGLVWGVAMWVLSAPDDGYDAGRLAVKTAIGVLVVGPLMTVLRLRDIRRAERQRPDVAGHDVDET
jgi:hypothetical protein